MISLFSFNMVLWVAKQRVKKSVVWDYWWNEECFLVIAWSSDFRKLLEPPYIDSIEWSEWHVFWVDERVVPKDHEDSNYKLAYDGFLSKVWMLIFFSPFPCSKNCIFRLYCYFFYLNVLIWILNSVFESYFIALELIKPLRCGFTCVDGISRTIMRSKENMSLGVVKIHVLCLVFFSQNKKLTNNPNTKHS